MTYKAEEIAGNPDLFNKQYAFSVFGKKVWDCLGYSKSGNAIIFAHLIPTDNGKVRQITRYVKPKEIMLG